jgi:hypothetical protein
MYTIFDLPIHVTNEILANSTRPSCDSLNNNLLTQEVLNASANNFVRIPGTALETNKDGSGKDGLGAAAAVDWRSAVHGVWILSFALMFVL